MKKLKFSSEKCRVLNNNNSSNGDTLLIEDKALNIENSTSRIRDVFNDKADNTALCKDIGQIRQAVGTISFVARAEKSILVRIKEFQICSFVKEGSFGHILQHM